METGQGSESRVLLISLKIYLRQSVDTSNTLMLTFVQLTGSVKNNIMQCDFVAEINIHWDGKTL